MARVTTESVVHGGQSAESNKHKKEGKKMTENEKNEKTATASPETESPVSRPSPGSPKCYGLDVGTMNLVSAHVGKDGGGEDIILPLSMRNMFLPIDAEHVGNLDLGAVDHVVIDGAHYILSEDAFGYGNVFGLPVRRPMKDGLICSSDGVDGLEMLAVMIRRLIGQGDGSPCCFSVPANPIDSPLENVYHEGALSRIIAGLGHRPVPINEAMAVVLSELGDSNYTGIGISCGAGMTNVAVSYMRQPVLTFSVGRGGDWIDTSVASSVGLVPNRVTQRKERENFTLRSVDLSKIRKQDRPCWEALVHFYRALVSYVGGNIAKQLSGVTAEFPSEIPIVVSGGTSRADGFVEMVQEVFDEFEFPFDVSEVRRAEDPMTAVAVGCLINAERVASPK